MYQYNIHLKSYNSFQTEASAKIFCEPTDIAQLKQCLLDFREEQKLIIGSGCNLFFTKDFDGLVIHPQIFGIREISDISDESDEVYLEVMASEDWDNLVEFCVDKGYSGLENLSYIPSTVGAAPVQNIGAYGAEVKDCIHEVIALDMKTLEVISFSNAECEFAYRDSIFKKQQDRYAIISVVFMLKRSYTYTPKYTDLNNELADVDSPTIRDVRDAVVRIRQRKLPDHKELPNCGSFFKNPYITREIAERIKLEYPDLPIYPIDGGLLKTSAAFLIDRAGYKGKQLGQIGTYPKQALIVVNYGSTDGNDIVYFKNEIQKAVFEKFAIELEPEVRIL
ncbi:UDP-N-acetylmuramate dehydrogenase [Dysgonomonas macrotermitis]|uniref:UDP-N-acetylenolpyruvoylglucosamine reductase n=1 Tax=Dysgonomonas macrotermitis TaxID=1346286 RepID=A0A1M5E2C7_9BACT|nr:UDP-N-acetylmuramate dehydrogenase [Dysgonomonas macrotermitis]SHF73336.1 UDP-N-acetylmuramate dehydrogenase [Dysgonomonas macrotermitis]